MTTTQFDRFVDLLCKLPIDTWNASVSDSASFKRLKAHSQVWPFGRFASLYVVLGLNDYQTRGRAEVGYWPKVLPLVLEKPAPKSPADLQRTLSPFFATERMGTRKVNRLDCFLNSPLCHRMWSSNAATLAAEFQDVWLQLARTMNQKPEKKTIAFAMKCLAYALIMVNETGFDFGAIPVPVDSRICTLSQRLGIVDNHGDAERARWQAALQKIRKSIPSVTMLHLDSVAWQIGTLSTREITTHLRQLGASDRVALEISRVIGDH